MTSSLPLPSSVLKLPFVFRGGDGYTQVTIWRSTHHSWRNLRVLYRVDPHISLAVNKTRKEFLSGSPFSQIIKMLSHSEYVVSFAPCTSVQASTLHPGTKTAYWFTNSQLSCLLYDSCSEENFKQDVLFVATIARTQDGETCLVSSVFFFFFSLSSVIFFFSKS